MSCPNTSVDVSAVDQHAETVDAVCEKHGPYLAKRFKMPLDLKPVTTACPTCIEESRARGEARKAEQERLQRQLRIEQLFCQSGIPPRFIDRTLENFHAIEPAQQKVLSICTRYAEAFSNQDGRSLILVGPPGTGKTHLSCAIGNSAIRNGYAVLFITVAAAIRRVKDTYRKNSESSETAAIKSFLEPDLLILDEIGAQVGSEHEKLLMFEIINERYQRMRSTILISNLTYHELGEFLGDRVVDRFRESGAVLALEWKSHRGQSKGRLGGPQQ